MSPAQIQSNTGIIIGIDNVTSDYPSVMIGLTQTQIQLSQWPCISITVIFNTETVKQEMDYFLAVGQNAPVTEEQQETLVWPSTTPNWSGRLMSCGNRRLLWLNKEALSKVAVWLNSHYEDAGD